LHQPPTQIWNGAMPNTQNTLDRLSLVERRLTVVEDEMKDMRTEVHEIRTKTDSIYVILTQARGVKWLVVAFGGVVMVVSAAVTIYDKVTSFLHSVLR